MLMFPMSTSPEVTGQLVASVLLISSAGAFVSRLTVVGTTPLVPFDIVSVCVTAMNPAPTGGVTVSEIRSSSSVTVKLNNPLSSVVQLVYRVPS